MKRTLPNAGRSSVASLQIANQDVCIIVRTMTFSMMEKVRWLILGDYRKSKEPTPLPRCVQDLLEDESVFKVGVEIKEDARRLYRDFGVRCKSVVDLKSLYTRAYGSGSQSNRSKMVGDGIGLHALSKLCLGVTLEKNHSLRCSDWSAPVLSIPQLEYAAKDAWVAPRIAATLLDKIVGQDAGDRQERYPCC